MFEFKPLTISDQEMQLMCEWLNTPHVAENWNRVPANPEETRKKYQKLIGENHVFAYIIYYADQPVGFVQSYNANETGGGWWENEPLGTWGMGMFIGEVNMLGKGLGSQAAKEFVELLQAQEGVSRVIVDPKPTNKRAIRAYQKAGFNPLGEIQTPDGEALLMEFKKN